jgi:hypothetical protein
MRAREKRYVYKAITRGRTPSWRLCERRDHEPHRFFRPREHELRIQPQHTIAEAPDPASGLQMCVWRCAEGNIAAPPGGPVSVEGSVCCPK